MKSTTPQPLTITCLLGACGRCRCSSTLPVIGAAAVVFLSRSSSTVLLLTRLVSRQSKRVRLLTRPVTHLSVVAAVRWLIVATVPRVAGATIKPVNRVGLFNVSRWMNRVVCVPPINV